MRVKSSLENYPNNNSSITTWLQEALILKNTISNRNRTQCIFLKFQVGSSYKHLAQLPKKADILRISHKVMKNMDDENYMQSKAGHDINLTSKD
jgi:hypothetical protein